MNYQAIQAGLAKIAATLAVMAASSTPAACTAPSYGAVVQQTATTTYQQEVSDCVNQKEFTLLNINGRADATIGTVNEVAQVFNSCLNQ